MKKELLALIAVELRKKTFGSTEPEVKTDLSERATKAAELIDRNVFGCHTLAVRDLVTILLGEELPVGNVDGDEEDFGKVVTIVNNKVSDHDYDKGSTRMICMDDGDIYTLDSNCVDDGDIIYDSEYRKPTEEEFNSFVADLGKTKAKLLLTTFGDFLGDDFE